MKNIGQEWIFFDGGMGTLLQEAGLPGGVLPETWNLDNPDAIKKINKDYLEAGADIFSANTFGANALKFPDNLDEIVTAAMNIAKDARSEANRPDAKIALDIGPSGKLLAPMGDLEFEDAVSLFAKTIEIGVREGCDLILIETMSDLYEAKAAVLAAKENSNLPVYITATFDESGKLLTGGSVEAFVAVMEGLKVDALGVNCGLGPKQMLPIVKRMVECASIPVIVNPNAGLPRTEGGKTVYDVGPEDFSETMEELANLGIQAAGGCCGTTPEHIRLTKEKLTKTVFVKPAPKNKTYVTSFSQTVEIGEKPIIIGERINPTGKKRFKQALRDKDFDYILNEGLNQEDAGADILDVNVGLPEIDEPEMMENVVKKLQSITGLPLQLDTSDPKALERGMRIYNGKPMINSVNGKDENIEQVMPLVAKYGGVLVALPIDEDGIPTTADGRIKIANKILEAADKYNIPRKDIVIDGLAMTVSSDQTSAIATLETIRRIRDELKGHSVLGVSNISFGLPCRPIINSYFFCMAMQNGLSCAIINPQSDQMMAAYRSFLALQSLDPQCAGYINAYADAAVGKIESTQTAKQQTDTNAKATLAEAVERGLTGRAAEAMKEGIEQGTDPLKLIDSDLIPALDKVGKGFESGTIFLPQLLMSADAAKAAFDVVKQSMAGKPKTSKGKVILATVKGDIHDIGKNIVKVMLENYGYDVLDLGKDVPPETIVKAALENNIKLVGLSALMTTTVPSMEETIKQLRQESPNTKVVVGGAVLTQEYADMIGADAYAKDAMATVRYADEVFGNQ